MIPRDRELLVRLRRFNAEQLPGAVTELLAHLDGERLPADGLRGLAAGLDALAAEVREAAAESEREAAAEMVIEHGGEPQPLDRGASEGADPESSAGRALRGIRERPDPSGG